MRVAVFSTKAYDRESLEAVNQEHGHDLVFFEARLTQRTAALANGFGAVCAFTNDQLDRETLESLSRGGTRLVALRCAGFNNVDLKAAEKLKLTVARVPAYSPHAVAEHTAALILTLNRKVHRAYARVREQNFELSGLLGFDLHGKTAGVVGTGRIGQVVAKIMLGFGCRVLAHDPVVNKDVEGMGVSYVGLRELVERSDIITLHSPLTPGTRHLINDEAFGWMKQGAMLVNTSRGAVVDTKAAIRALKSGRLGYLGLDVYEEEADLFFRNLSDQVIQDDVFARLLTFPNVVVTAHQAFFTREALGNIAQTTLGNVAEFEKTGSVPGGNEVTASLVAK